MNHFQTYETEAQQKSRMNVDRSLKSEVVLCLREIDECFKKETPEQAIECLKSAFGLADRIQHPHWQSKAKQDLRKIYDQNRETAKLFGCNLD